MKEEGNIGIGYDPTSSLLEMPTMRTVVPPRDWTPGKVKARE